MELVGLLGRSLLVFRGRSGISVLTVEFMLFGAVCLLRTVCSFGVGFTMIWMWGLLFWGPHLCCFWKELFLRGWKLVLFLGGWCLCCEWGGVYYEGFCGCDLCGTGMESTVSFMVKSRLL